ncbi:MAG: hypothetical protein V2A58_13025 [Planctomycetota bacterium]
MTAGLPGTGIGGIFYVLLAVLMPALEAGRAMRRRSSLRRFGMVAGHFALSAGIVGALWLEWWGLQVGFAWLFRHFYWNPTIYKMCTMASAAVTPTVAAAPFIILGSIVVALNIFSFALKRADSKRLGLSRAKVTQAGCARG